MGMTLEEIKNDDVESSCEARDESAPSEGPYTFKKRMVGRLIEELDASRHRGSYAVGRNLADELLNCAGQAGVSGTELELLAEYGSFAVESAKRRYVGQKVKEALVELNAASDDSDMIRSNVWADIIMSYIIHEEMPKKYVDSLRRYVNQYRQPDPIGLFGQI